jgi:hypothetical protein
LENSYGLDEPVPYFLEIRCEQEGVRIRKNRITDFPEYRCEGEQIFSQVEEALAVFHSWAEEILQKLQE